MSAIAADDDPKTWRRRPLRWAGSRVHGFPLEKVGEVLHVSCTWTYMHNQCLRLNKALWLEGRIRWWSNSQSCALGLHDAGFLDYQNTDDSWLAMLERSKRDARAAYHTMTCASQTKRAMPEITAIDDQNFIRYYGLKGVPVDDWDQEIEEAPLDRTTGNFVLTRHSGSSLPRFLMAPTGRQWFHCDGAQQGYNVRDVADSIMELRRGARSADLLSFPNSVHALHAHIKHLLTLFTDARYLLLPLDHIVLAYLYPSFVCPRCACKIQ